MRDAILSLERRSRALEPGATRRRHLRDAAVALTERFLRRIATTPGYDASPNAMQGLLGTPISQDGIPLAAALDILEQDVIRPGAQPASAGHLAYIPGGGIYHSALGDFIAAVTNKYAGVFFAGPGAVRMENILIRWTADLVGYPAGAGGNIASGGSIANLTAVATARDAYELRGSDYATAVVYLTTQAHHSVDRALRIAGMADTRVRHVGMDERYRMRPDALADAIARDRAAGLQPWLVVATAGTTDSGAVDPLDAIADVVQRERCWFHVDAAYGGFFLLTEHGRSIMRGIERSDSAVLDPHKGMFLPYGSGIVIVRDAEALARTHRYAGAYMQDTLREPSDVSPADVSPELTRHFRALRMWLPLMLVGTKPFAAALDEKLLLARYFHREIGRLGFEVGPEPDLSVVPFRWAPAGMGLEEANRLNQDIVDALRRDGRIFLSSTMLEGRFTLRLAVLAFRTHLRTIDLALELLRHPSDLVP